MMVGALLIDLSKVIDTVSHQQLLLELQVGIGCGHGAIQFFKTTSMEGNRDSPSVNREEYEHLLRSIQKCSTRAKYFSCNLQHIRINETSRGI